MGMYCDGCGGRLTWAAIPQEIEVPRSGAVEVHEATQCTQCELELPRRETTVHIDGEEFAYHATPDCRHMLAPSDWATPRDNAEGRAIPCAACFGDHDPEPTPDAGEPSEAEARAIADGESATESESSEGDR